MKIIPHQIHILPPRFQPTQQHIRLTLGIGLLLLTAVYSNDAYSQSNSDFEYCSENFAYQLPPSYQKAEFTKQTYPLCYQGFAIMYSGMTRTPLWSAEYLTRQRLEQADTMEREDSFHEERRIPKSARADLKDYSGSGYDRGHLAPNADMANFNQQYDSFSLANIAPQSPHLNRSVWKQIESATRYITKVHGQSFVVTGLVFNKKHKIAKSVRIPSHFYKVVYLPSTPLGEQAGVYYAPNDESGRIEVISIAQLAKRTGINAMPALSQQVRNMKGDLPLPNESFKDSAMAQGANQGNKGTNQSQQNQEQQNQEVIASLIVLLGKWLLATIVWIGEQISK